MKRKTEMVDTIAANGLWGYEPEIDKHDAFIGYRAIYHKGAKWLDYLWNRQCAKGEKKTVEALCRWWSKRGGAESKWLKYQESKMLKSQDTEGEVYVFVDSIKGNIAKVRAAGGYAYISLYHDDAEVGRIESQGEWYKAL